MQTIIAPQAQRGYHPIAADILAIPPLVSPVKNRAAGCDCDGDCGQGDCDCSSDCDDD